MVKNHFINLEFSAEFCRKIGIKFNLLFSKFLPFSKDSIFRGRGTFNDMPLRSHLLWKK